MKKSIYILILIFLVSCARNFTIERSDWTQYNKAEAKQTKEDITIERHIMKTIPEDLFIANRKDMFSGAKLPDIYLVPYGGIVEKISITNNTKHVIRLGSAVFRAFDPAGNQFPILSKAELMSIVYKQLTPNLKPEQSYSVISSCLRTIKLIETNTELLPNYTTTGYIVYIPENWKMPGIWKLSIYDFPVETDNAGRAVRTVHFNFRIIAKMYLDRYEDNQLVESIELE